MAGFGKPCRLAGDLERLELVDDCPVRRAIANGSYVDINLGLLPLGNRPTLCHSALSIRRQLNARFLPALPFKLSLWNGSKIPDPAL